MTITIDSISLDSDLYLQGVTQSTPRKYTQIRTVEGNSIVISKATPGGRELTLSTTNMNGARQGLWCQSIIDKLKLIQENGSAVKLIYYNESYIVYVVDTSDLHQLYQFEPPGPSKSFIGSVKMIEG